MNIFFIDLRYMKTRTTAIKTDKYVYTAIPSNKMKPSRYLNYVKTRGQVNDVSSSPFFLLFSGFFCHLHAHKQRIHKQLAPVVKSDRIFYFISSLKYPYSFYSLPIFTSPNFFNSILLNSYS